VFTFDDKSMGQCKPSKHLFSINDLEEIGYDSNRSRLSVSEESVDTPQTAQFVNDNDNGNSKSFDRKGQQKLLSGITVKKTPSSMDSSDGSTRPPKPPVGKPLPQSNPSRAAAARPPNEKPLDGYLDPSDILTGLDERLSHVVNRLSPTEILQIQRRVRNVVQEVLSKPTGVNTPLFSAGTTQAGMRKQTIQKNVIDDFVFKKVFSSGYDKWTKGIDELSTLKQVTGKNGKHWGSGAVGYWGQKKIKDKMAKNHKEGVLDLGNVDRIDDKDEEGLSASLHSAKDSTAKDDTHQQPSDSAQSQPIPTYRYGPKRNSQENSPVPVNANTVLPPPDPKGKYKPDPIGSAYLLLLSLAETRWDSYAAAAASITTNAISAMDDKELVDTNFNTNTNFTTRSQTKNGGIFRKGSEKLTKEQIGTNGGPTTKYAAFVPADTSALSTENASNLDSSLPSLSPTIMEMDPPPSGISFLSLCFAIALALRGNRDQKLCLLFHILIPPKQLKSLMLQSTFFPSYMFEIGFHHDATLLSLASRDIQPHRFPSQLKVSSLATIDAITALRRSQHNHIDDDQDLQHETNDNNNGNYHAHNVEDKYWSYNEFIDWANNIPLLDDFGLDSILQNLFGTGILTSNEEEKYLVRKCWMIWQIEETEWEATRQRKLVHARANHMHSYNDEHEYNEWNIGKQPGENGTKSKKLRGVWGFVNGSAAETPAQLPMSTLDPQADRNTASSNTHYLKSFNNHPSKKVWGGIGNFDGRGGLGFGVMYCIDKKWWDQWEAYSGWQWENVQNEKVFRESSRLLPVDFLHGDRTNKVKRPPELTTDHLLEESSLQLGGTLGSYELMKHNLIQDVDYVLVPPGVWDILFELYGGGPPLPRMVSPQQEEDNSAPIEVLKDDLIHRKIDFDIETENDSVSSRKAKASNNFHVAAPHTGTNHTTSTSVEYPTRLPGRIKVVTHPWVIHCQVCDSLQPYRRGDAGTVSIRVMVTPDQPFWRFFAELVVRLPIHHPRGRNASGQGKARLWKQVDPAQAQKNNKELPGACRYGPWSLLCKGRHASFPVGVSNSGEKNNPFSEYEKDWCVYADYGTVESIGLFDGMRVMFEYAVITAKEGIFTWPREAAAKAGRARRLADEDAAFRLQLRGVETSGNSFEGTQPLEGMIVDAMDSTGRWYQAEIVQVEKRHRRREIFTDEGLEEDDEDYLTDEALQEEGTDQNPHTVTENWRVRVDFSEMSCHEEWILVDSDRLAIAGRYTLDSMKSLDVGGTEFGSSSPTTEGKPRQSVTRKLRDNRQDSFSENGNMTICPFPGHGACGLTNLGNTCYANAAMQCLGYMPLIRSYLISGQYKTNGDLNRHNPLGTSGRVLEELAELLRILWSGKYSARAPVRFKTQLGKARSQFSGTDQQDAQELLNAVFDALHEDSNRVLKKPIVPPLEDSWVKNTGLPRVGLEAWRRFLRRNRSFIANIAMGQVLNRVTCPNCNYCSRNFDPFNMLSIPFPTVAEVVFRCTIVRRGTALNCPGVLGPKGFINSQSKKQKNKQNQSALAPEFSPPSENLIMEEYIVAMSRLADVGDLKLRLQNLSGISAECLKLCKSEEIVVDANIPKSDIAADTRTFTKVMPLPEKEGPCVQLVKQTPNEVSASSVALTEIIAFESTLKPRQQFNADINETVWYDDDENAEVDSCDLTVDSCDDLSEAEDRFLRHQKLYKRKVQAHVKVYGDNNECRMVDSDPTFLARAVSQSLWPTSCKDFKLGLRVDAIDQRHHWFPGSVVEISDFNSKPKQTVDGASTSRRVRVHFDNFSSKWDEWYAFRDFQKNQVRPLYSHATPRSKPTEVIVHHRHGSSRSSGDGSSTLFGHPFYLQLHNEWSTARAGAHILAQAARFLHPTSKGMDNHKVYGGRQDRVGQSGNFRPGVSMKATPGIPNEEERIIYELAEGARSALSEAIEILVESERQYIKVALASDSCLEEENEGDGKQPGQSTRKGMNGEAHDQCFALRAVNDASAMTQALSEKLGSLLPRLPFDVRVCSSDAPLGGGRAGSGNEEQSFPFSLVRTVGNYLNSRFTIVLHWRNIRIERSERNPHFSGVSTSTDGSKIASVLYVRPKCGIHIQSHSILGSPKKSPSSEDKRDSPHNQHKGKGSRNTGGIHLGVCLTEFCKEQQLTATDCWRCPKCKEVREGRQSMALWRLPDILTFHIKRFNCSARWREKISTKINFPLTGLNMSEWCAKESPALDSTNADDVPEESSLYDLIGVVNHFGGMTGGHYVATCKASACGVDGSEEVAHNFNGAGASGCGMGGVEAVEGQTGVWGRTLGRGKDKDSSIAAQQNRAAAVSAARTASESAEPLWLQFDDDLVEPIPPKNVVSEMAYVLFYRRRRLTPSNIAKYCTLE